MQTLKRAQTDAIKRERLNYIFAFMVKNKLLYRCKSCDIKLSFKEDNNKFPNKLVSLEIFALHLNHDLEISKGFYYTILEVSKEQSLNDISVILDIPLGVILNHYLRIKTDKKEYLLINTIITHKKSVLLKILDSIPINISTLYKNEINHKIRTKIYTTPITFNMGLSLKDGKYLYSYIYHKIFLYFGIKKTKPGDVFYVRDDLIWFHTKQIKNSYNMKMDMPYERWKELFFIPALNYFVKTHVKESKDIDNFCLLYKHIKNIVFPLMQSSIISSKSVESPNNSLEREKEVNSNDHSIKGLFKRCKSKLSNYLNKKIDKTFETFLTYLLKMHLYDKSNSLSLRSLSLLTGISYTTVQKYIKFLLKHNIIHDRKKGYKFKDKHINSFKQEELKHEDRVVITSDITMKKYKKLHEKYSKDWFSYYKKVITKISDKNDNEITEVASILLTTRSNDDKSLKDRGVTLNISFNKSKYVHKPYIVSLRHICKGVISLLDGPIGERYMRAIYSKLKRTLENNALFRINPSEILRNRPLYILFVREAKVISKQFTADKVVLHVDTEIQKFLVRRMVEEICGGVPTQCTYTM